MAYKRRGIVARPGVHKRLDGTEEVITWEELKESVLFQNRIPLVQKHPETGYIDPKDRIGTVTQRANEELQVIEGEYWFFEEPEYWSQLSPELRKKILSGDEIKTISAGYRVPKHWEGDYKPRHYDHIAVDVPNPMQDIGITKGDVRMEESKLPSDFRIEETPEISEEHKEGTLPPKAVPYDPVNFGRMIGKLEAEVESLRKELAESKKPQTSPAAPERTEEPEPAVMEKTSTPDPPKAKTTVPMGATSKKDAPDEDGRFIIRVE